MKFIIKNSTFDKIIDLIQRYPQLSNCENDIFYMVDEIISCYNRQGKMLICGNGGSAADSLHIVGELMKGFLLPRKLENFNNIFLQRAYELFPSSAELFKEKLQCALPAISLVNEISLITAFSNDVSSNLIFAQQVLSLGKKEDILLAISTSGNSDNILFAVEVAKILDLKVIALTGEKGGRLKHLSDIAVCVPANRSYTIQELHLPIYHMLCLALENEFFSL